jgi:hypothetical protein
MHLCFFRELDAIPRTLKSTQRGHQIPFLVDPCARGFDMHCQGLSTYWLDLLR